MCDELMLAKYKLQLNEFAESIKDEKTKTRYQNLFQIFGDSATKYIMRELSFNVPESNKPFFTMVFKAGLKKKKYRKRINENVKVELLRSQKGICPCCNKPVKDPVVDHFIPWRIVGDELNTEGNIRVICRGCNITRGCSMS